MTPYDHHIKGCLVGTVVGDAIGLPREGISRRRAERLFGGRPLRHGMIVGRGLCSDDTEHTVMVAQSFVTGGRECLEYWISAEELDQFNDNIVGEIEAIHEFVGESLAGGKDGE